MNSNSIAVLRNDYPTNHPLQLQSLTGSTTNEQLFQMNSVTNTTAVVSIPSQTAIVGSATPFDPNANPAYSLDALGSPLSWRGRARPYFNSNSFLGRGFVVRAMGYINNLAGTTNAQTTTIKITLGNAVSASKVLVSIASATNFASGGFNVAGNLIWDSTSQALYGSQTGFIGGLPNTAGSALSNEGVAVAAYTSLTFCCSIVFATSSASSVANLVEFAIEQL